MEVKKLEEYRIWSANREYLMCRKYKFSLNINIYFFYSFHVVYIQFQTLFGFSFAGSLNKSSVNRILIELFYVVFKSNIVYLLNYFILYDI